MPATPLHFSAIAWLHFKKPKRFDFTALLCSSMLVDFELLFFLCTGQPLNHGIWHSYLFILTVYPIVTGFVIYAIERWFSKTLAHIYRVFRFFPTNICYSMKSIYACCLIGGASHIFLDMLTHEESHYVLYPLYSMNPFWMGAWEIVIIAVIVLLSLYSVLLWSRQMRIRVAK